MPSIPVVRLDELLRLDSLDGASVHNVALDAHVSRVTLDGDGALLLNESGTVVAELRASRTAAQDARTIVPAGSWWGAALEIQQLLLDRSQVLAEVSGDVLHQLAEADHIGSTVERMIALLADLVGNPISLKDSRHRMVTWAGNYELLDPMRREVVDEGEVPPRMQEALVRRGILERIRTERRAFRVDGDPDVGMTPRVVCPIRIADVLLGYLSISEGARKLGPLDFLAVETGATVLSFQMSRERAVDEHRRSRRALTAYDLVFGPGRKRPETVRRHASALGIDQQSAHVAIVLLHAPKTAMDGDRWARERAAMEVTLEDFLVRRRVASCLTVATDDALGVFLTELPDGGVDLLARQALKEIAAYHTSERHSAGVSGPRSSVAEWERAFDEAHLAAQIGLEGGSEVVHYRRVGALRLLRAVPEDLATAHIEEVLGSDPRFRSMFQSTFGALVASRYNKAEAARSLHIHLNTLKYRLNRIKTTTGLDVDEPGDRYALESAQRLLELRGFDTPASG